VRSRSDIPREPRRVHLGNQSHRQGERGQELIEFAFASVIFFVMMFAIIEFGLAVWKYNLVSDLSQEGARWAAVHGPKSKTPADILAVRDYVRGRAIGLTVTATCPPAAGQICVSMPLGDPSGITAGNPVEVKLVYTLAVGGGLLRTWNFPIQSRAQMIVAR
jgi:hypothetical protein